MSNARRMQRLLATQLRYGHRRLKCEALEDRRVLAVVTVTQAGDPGIDTDDNAIDLREAIAYVNLDEVPVSDVNHIDLTEGWGQNDKIIIPSSIGSTITLTEGQMEIERSVEIQGPGSGMLTIDADSDDDGVGDSRIFYISDGARDTLQDVRISGLPFAGC
ncbi:hypothetical protein NG895_07730 [Aeoliella sp. ICT_H6.2]|uniref:Uncharacterized protein n=1 Tax=Aeoliella straminimaris TaxID=2954799 RepID=A0A9X2F8H4_9BACT|nr:hypothetical protein [Aeoliella straminimaris]MCO6043794.1 hypothetical protein [Aeoliella straminimaris]